MFTKNTKGQSQLPRGLRRRYAVARLLGLPVRITPTAWIFVIVSAECSGIALRRADYPSRGALPTVVRRCV